MKTCLSILFNILLVVLLALLPSSLLAQKKSKVNIENANTLFGVGPDGNKTNKLIGNVIFKQDDIYLYCDSAFLYEISNSIDAFGHVHIQQGDSTHLYGDLLKYDGNTKIAELFDNIRLLDHTLVLTTDRLTYDLKLDQANYNNNARIVDKKNVLTSQRGFYYANNREFLFKDHVVLSNPEYTMSSDTLKYNSKSKTAFFFGPSNIFSKENRIYCENGYYNTISGLAQFKKNAVIYSDKEQLTGDSLMYDRKLGIGKAIRNVTITDTVQKMVINGDYGTYFRQKDISIVTGHALMTKYLDKDTLYLHADTLKSSFDSCTTERKLYAYHQARIFKSDLRAYCDSMTYSSLDSLIRLHKNPIVWSDKNQLTANFISIQIKNRKIDKLHLLTNSFIISQEDSTRFNQIKGKNMTGFFSDNKLYKMKVEGNGQTVYYGKDNDKKLVGVNKANCSDLLIFIKDTKVERITLLNKPDATFYPLNELSPKELILKDFNWQPEKQPQSKEDLMKDERKIN